MVMPEKVELLGMDLPEMENFVQEQGEPKFRARQLHKWIYNKSMSSFFEMSDLPRTLRYKLDQVARISIPRVLKQRVSQDGTRKYLVEFLDKKRVETVLIPQGKGRDARFTLCISSQVGCPLGCAFCATGAGGFQRNLQAYEIVGELLASRRELQKKLRTDDEGLISNLVYMGMGEPLLNYEEVLRSIHIFNDPRGLNIGQRHITISTAGDVRGIYRLSREELQVTLAISLHASNDELRNQLIPLNRRYPLEALIRAVEDYIEETNRRVTFEYLLLEGVNDNRKDARELIELLKPLLANINLIPYNEVEGLPFKKPAAAKVTQFQSWLLDGGLNAVIREEHGTDIEAACGQLRLANRKPTGPRAKKSAVKTST